ncbi:MAG: hypothetical protein ACLUVC_13285 [Longibaculum sp.]
MFKLRYRIFEKEFDMQDNNSNSLEEQSSIYGFISLKFNQKEIGYIVDEDEAPSPEDNECEIYLYHDNLTWWFETLLEVSNLLLKNTYVRFKLLEAADRWISFEKDNSNVIVTFFEYFDLGSDIVSLSRISPKNVEYTEIIDLSDFQKEVIMNANKFIQEIANINQNLLNANRLNSLCQQISCFKGF